ncbi:MAG TPA: beta-ketoacyl synthase N-terminal-like domain-containing protein [Pseudoduganella sp.]
MRSPLGFDATASAAAVRGAISAISVHPHFIDKTGERMCLARDAGLGIDVVLTLRLETLLISAIGEALKHGLPAAREMKLGCWIGIPEPRAGMPVGLHQSLSASVADRFGLLPPAIKVLPRGHAAGLMAMQAAAESISTGEIEVCIAAGVDSYHDPDTLEWLDQCGLLMSAANRNGFPPSEAAGACLLASRHAANHYGLPVLGSVRAAATALEPHPIRSTGVCIGEGLSTVIKDIIARCNLPHGAISATYCDLNGERYRNEEFAYTLLRVQDAFVDAHDYLSPADCWGDVGAASGLCFASLAISAKQRGYAKGSSPLLWAGSESGYRTAVLMNLGHA